MGFKNTDAEKVRRDFPILTSADDALVYLDNAATSQKPKQVIDTIKLYYETINSNIHRGIYNISEASGDKYHKSKEKIVKFINAHSPDEIIYTKNTTESINLVANSLLSVIDEDKKDIVVTRMEHHSNFVPWQQFAEKNGFQLKIVDIDEDFSLDMEDLKKKISEETAIVAVTHVSNTLGTVNPVKEITDISHGKGALVIVDAAQSVPHMSIDVDDIDCDFLAFSSHKMMGPMGLGVLYGKKDILKNMEPSLYGGDMISDVSEKSSSWNDLPMKFEAGTPNVSGAIGLSSAIDYLNAIGLENIHSWVKFLADETERRLKEFPEISLYRSKSSENSGIISFSVDGLHHHDLAQYLSDMNICIRVGHHCTMPLMKRLGIEGTARVSFYAYNTLEDVKKFSKAMKEVLDIFKYDVKR